MTQPAYFNSSNLDGFKELFPDEEYTLITKKAMMGLAIFCFCKKKLHSSISHVKKTEVKTGYGGNVGNKGSVVIRFNIHETSLAIACSHLESGKKNVEGRLKNITNIISEPFNNLDKKYRFLKHDIKLLFGDLNFRVNMEYDEVMKDIDSLPTNEESVIVDKLFGNDQLNLLKNKNEWLNEFKEMDVTFMPTYKFESNTDKYDKSEK